MLNGLFFAFKLPKSGQSISKIYNAQTRNEFILQCLPSNGTSLFSDITNILFPDADLKLFDTSSIEFRDNAVMLDSCLITLASPHVPTIDPCDSSVMRIDESDKRCEFITSFSEYSSIFKRGVLGRGTL